MPGNTEGGGAADSASERISFTGDVCDLSSQGEGLPVHRELQDLSVALEGALETGTTEDVLRICTRAKAWLADKDANHMEWGFWAGVIKFAEELHRLGPMGNILKEQRQTFLAEWRIARNPEHF
jgi:hypothetical protein